MVEVSSEMVACDGRRGRRKVCCQIAEAPAVVSVTVAWEGERTSGTEGRMMVMMVGNMVVGTVAAEA